MNKLLQTTLVSAIMATSGLAAETITNTIEGNLIWSPKTDVNIENGHTLTITGGTIQNYTNFAIKNYKEGDTATTILDQTSEPPAKFINKADIIPIDEQSQVVIDAGLEGTEYNISIGNVGDGINFQDEKGEEVIIPPADLKFLLTDDWNVESSNSRVLNIVGNLQAIEPETVTLKTPFIEDKEIHVLNCNLATLPTEGKTYIPAKTHITADLLIGNFENVTIPVELNSDSGSIVFQTELSNFPNSDVTVHGDATLEFGKEDNPVDFKINKSLTIEQSKLKINSGCTLTLSPDAKLTLGNTSGATLETGSVLYL